MNGATNWVLLAGVIVASSMLGYLAATGQVLLAVIAGVLTVISIMLSTSG